MFSLYQSIRLYTPLANDGASYIRALKRTGFVNSSFLPWLIGGTGGLAVYLPLLLSSAHYLRRFGSLLAAALSPYIPHILHQRKGYGAAPV